MVCLVIAHVALAFARILHSFSGIKGDGSIYTFDSIDKTVHESHFHICSYNNIADNVSLYYSADSKMKGCMSTESITTWVNATICDHCDIIDPSKWHKVIGAKHVMVVDTRSIFESPSVIFHSLGSDSKWFMGYDYNVTSEFGSLIMSTCPIDGMADPQSQIEVGLTSTKVLAIDVDLFVGSYASSSSSSSSVLQVPSSTDDVSLSIASMCSKLTALANFAELADAFLLHSGFATHYLRLPYWIEVCHVTPLVVGIQELRPVSTATSTPAEPNPNQYSAANMFNVHYSYNHADVLLTNYSGIRSAFPVTKFADDSADLTRRSISYCLVKTIKGENAAFSTYNSAGASADDLYSFYCIQDLFDRLLQAQIDVDGDGFDAPRSLTFVSTMNLAASVSASVPGHHSDKRSSDAFLEYLELLEVVKAFGSRGWYASGEPAGAGAAVRLRVISLTLMKHSGPAQEGNVIHPSVGDAVSETFVVDGDEGMFGHFVASSGDGSGSKSSCFPLEISTDSACFAPPDQPPVETSMLISNAAADAHVLVFVEDTGSNGAELKLAEEVLQSWREGCVLFTCQFFSRYNLIPVRSLGNLTRPAAPVSSTGGASDGALASLQRERLAFPLLSPYELSVRAPNIPLHSVLEETHRYIHDVMGQFDTLAVLVGLEALLAFEQPGKDAVGDADYMPPFIPNSQYGSSIMYPLKTPLVVGVRPTATAADADADGTSYCRSMIHLTDQIVSQHSVGSETESESETVTVCGINVFAFGGSGLGISRFISKVRRSASLMDGALPSKQISLRWANLHLLHRLKLTAVHYAAHRYVSLDTDSQFFRFGYAGSKLSLTYTMSTCVAVPLDLHVGGGVGGEMPSTDLSMLFSSSSYNRCTGGCMSGQRPCKFFLYPAIQRPQADDTAPFDGSGSLDPGLGLGLQLGNSAPIQYGSELPEFFESVDPGTGKTPVSRLQTGAATIGSYGIDFDLLQKSYEETIGYCNAHQWVAATLRALYTMDTFIRGIPLDDKDIEDAGSVTKKDLLRLNRAKSNAIALRMAYVPIYNLLQGAPNMRKSAGRSSLAEFSLVRDLLQRTLDEYTGADDSTAVTVTPNGIEIIALHVALASAHSEVGDMVAARSAYIRSIVQVPYEVVQTDRVKWLHDRFKLNPCRTCTSNTATNPLLSSTTAPTIPEAMKNMPSAGPLGTPLTVEGRPIRTHFITVASDNNTELQLLEASAAISGISLTVIGLDKQYVHYGNKVQWLLDHITQAMSTTTTTTTTTATASAALIQEDDVIVFMDAYDVLVFPSIRPIAEHFASIAPTPIVFCTEHGLYPEFSSGWNYNKIHRYNKNYYSTATDMNMSERVYEDYLREHFVHDILDAKQLNSGCYIGRAGEVRDMLHFMVSQSEFYRDDQQMFVRYAQSNPQLVSVDTHRSFFRTAYRQFFDTSHLAFTVDFQMLPLNGAFMSMFSDMQSFPARRVLSANESVEESLQNDFVLHELIALIHQSVSSAQTAHPSHPNHRGSLDQHMQRRAAGRLQPTDVRLLHCNNKGSNSLYTSFGSLFIPGVRQYYYTGHVLNEQLLNVMRDITDGYYWEAWQVLFHSTMYGRFQCQLSSVEESVGHLNMNHASVELKQEVLVCYYRFKLWVIMDYLGLWDEFPAIRRGATPNKEYIKRYIHYLVPFNLKMYNN